MMNNELIAERRRLIIARCALKEKERKHWLTVDEKEQLRRLNKEMSTGAKAFTKGWARVLQYELSKPKDDRKTKKQLAEQMGVSMAAVYSALKNLRIPSKEIPNETGKINWRPILSKEMKKPRIKRKTKLEFMERLNVTINQINKALHRHGLPYNSLPNGKRMTNWTEVFETELSKDFNNRRTKLEIVTQERTTLEALKSALYKHKISYKEIPD